MLPIVHSGNLGRDGPQLERDDPKTLALDPGHYLADKPALDSIWLADNKGTVHG